MEEPYINAIVAILSVLVGAFITWQYQKYETRRTVHASRISAFRHCMVRIATQKNTLWNLRKQFLEGVQDNPNRHLLIKTVGDYGSHLTIDIEKMDFLIDIGQPQLFMELHSAKSNYEIVRGALAFRNKCMEDLRKIAKPVVDEVRKTIEFDVPIQNNHQLKETTDDLFNAVGDAFKSCDEMLRKLEEALLKFDPKATPIKVTFPSDDE